MSSSSSAPSLATNATSTSTPSPMSSSAPSPAKSVLNLPPGFHFLPTDAELVVHYLRPRLANASHRLPLPIFFRERILDYHPDTLIEKYRSYGEGRWFFFTERERKQTGTRPNRTTQDNGHWNATGSVRPIRSAAGVLVGCRRTLVFYEASRSRKKKNLKAGGLPPPEEEEEEGQVAAKAAKDHDGVKTEWTMYEYESLSSQAEFEALRTGNANKMDELVLCTIQKKKHSQEGGGERKKSTKRKTKEEGLELEDVPAAAAGGVVEQGSRAGTAEGQNEDRVLGAMEAAAGYNFNHVDPSQNMPYYYLTNSVSSPVLTPSQETLMSPAIGDNQIVMQQQNYFFINQSMSMKNSQSFHVQETPPQEFLSYLDTKMAVSRGGGNTMDHMLQNRFVNMMPSRAPPVPGTVVTSKSDVWGHSAELPHGDKPNRPLKSEDDWWSLHHQAKLPGREEVADNPYITSSMSFVPAPQQEATMMGLPARGNNQTVMHHRNFLNHSSNTWNSRFHAQATTLPQDDQFLPYSNLGGGSIMDHHMLQSRIVNGMPAAEAHNFTGFFPSLFSSNYGHLSTRMDHPGLSGVSFPPQRSHGAGSGIGVQGPLLNNQVNLNHQNSATAASMVGFDQRNGVGLAPKIV